MTDYTEVETKNTFLDKISNKPISIDDNSRLEIEKEVEQIKKSYFKDDKTKIMFKKRISELLPNVANYGGIDNFLENIKPNVQFSEDFFVMDKDSGNVYRNKDNKWYKLDHNSKTSTEIDPNNNNFFKKNEKNIFKTINLMKTTPTQDLTNEKILKIVKNHIESGSDSNTINTESRTYFENNGDDTYIKYTEDENGEVSKTIVRTDEKGNYLSEEKCQDLNDKDIENFEKNKKEQDSPLFKWFLKIIEAFTKERSEQRSR